MATDGTPMIIMAGPCGGGSFGPADTMDPTGVTRIVKIVIEHDDYVLYLSFDFERNGCVESKKLGAHYNGMRSAEITLQPSEYITKVKGKIDKGLAGNNSVIRSLTIETNLNKFGPYGGPQSGFDFELPTINNDTIKGEIIGFHGTKGGALDSIGAYIKVTMRTNATVTNGSTIIGSSPPVHVLQCNPPVQVLQCNETNIQVYAEQYWTGQNTNQTMVAQESLENKFGRVEVLDWTMRDGLGQYAVVLGRIQGNWTKSSYQSGDYWHINACMMFINERFKGSSVEVHGNFTPCVPFEWAIAGGTGAFTLAQGKVSGKILSQSSVGRVMELSIRVFHYPM